MSDVIEFFGVVIGVGLVLLAIVWGVSLTTAPKRDYVAQCTIENKTLPRPDLYCNALWTQAHHGKGGR